MADTLTTQQRCERMCRVGQKDTALEVQVRSELHLHGLRYCASSKVFSGTSSR